LEDEEIEFDIEREGKTKAPGSDIQGGGWEYGMIG
jgi:hypothetical protein